jgi:hypothetical protein
LLAASAGVIAGMLVQEAASEGGKQAPLDQPLGPPG